MARHILRATAVRRQETRARLYCCASVLVSRVGLDAKGLSSYICLLSHHISPLYFYGSEGGLKLGCIKTLFLFTTYTNNNEGM